MQKQTVSVIFTGDIGFDKHMAGRFRDPKLLSPEILEFFRSSDHVVANVEGALMNADSTGKNLFFHTMDPEAVCVLSDVGSKIWSIGNNHSMDAEEAGIISTLKAAEREGAVTIGAGRNLSEASRPVILEGAGGIGIFCVGYQPDCIPAGENTPGNFAWDDFEAIKEVIGEIKARCRWCVVVSHGGEEFTALPTPYTRDRYIRYLELGADAVVAHHPHVAENYERFENGKVIFYSLGNFIFDTDYQRAQPNTDAGVLLKLVFSENSMDFEPFGTKILRGSETVAAGPLPDIFTEVNAGEYALLAPLSAKAFLTAERRRMEFLEPKRFVNAEESVWLSYIHSSEPEGYVSGQHMDFFYVEALAEKAESGEWNRCSLEQVKNYILKLI